MWNLSWLPLFRYTTSNHASVIIVVTRNFLSLFLLGQSRSHGGICYHHFSQVSEHENVSIQSDLVLFSQWLFGIKTLMILQRFTGWILDRDPEQFLSDSISFLDGLSSPFYTSVSIPGCVWPIFLYVMS